MKRPFVWVLVTVIVVGMLGCYGAVRKYRKNPSLPQLDGTLKVRGLEGKVEVRIL